MKDVTKQAAHLGDMCAAHSDSPAVLALLDAAKDVDQIANQLKSAVSRKTSLSEQESLLKMAQAAGIGAGKAKELQATIKVALAWRSEARALLQNGSGKKLVAVKRLLDSG